MHEAEDPLRQALISALGAQYDVLRLIGRGGMGAVYLGRERLLDRLVAIKVLPHESAGTEDARERFLREARTAARLTHPNVVPLYSFGEAGSTLFYIMGYVEGESLEQRLRRDGRLSFDLARRILADLADALQHAHGLGIVHRDIKPDNVLLERGTDRPVLTDFGIARQQVAGNTITQTGVVVGTPSYMSPEQAAGERDIDGRSDIYSLGVMGYRMVTGRLPFGGGSFQELIAAHMTRDPVPMSSLVADVPPELDAAITRALAKDPARRFPNAAAMREALGGSDGTLVLPEDLENLPSLGANHAIIGYFGAWVGVALYAISRDPFWGVLPLLGVPAAALEIGMFVRKARAHGLGWRRVVRMAFLQPTWWHFAWPRTLRRPGDVWDRLPAVVRRMRLVTTAAATSAMGLFLPTFVLGIVMRWRDFGPAWLANDMVVGSIYGLNAVLVGIIGTSIWAGRWKRQFGLSASDKDKLLAMPTTNRRFWSRPEIARLLSNAQPAALEPKLETPGDFVLALERLSEGMADPWRPLLAEGIAAARQVVHSVVHLDDELRVLARDNDPAERERVQQRLAAMSDSTPGGSRQMRELLEGQLALMNQLTRRMEELSSRRARYLELLRTMWLQFSALRAQQAGDALSVSATTDQLRELCRDVEHAVLATR